MLVVSCRDAIFRKLDVCVLSEVRRFRAETSAAATLLYITSAHQFCVDVPWPRVHFTQIPEIKGSLGSFDSTVRLIGVIHLTSMTSILRGQLAAVIFLQVKSIILYYNIHVIILICGLAVVTGFALLGRKIGGLPNAMPLHLCGLPIGLSISRPKLPVAISPR